MTVTIPLLDFPGVEVVVAAVAIYIFIRISLLLLGF